MHRKGTNNPNGRPKGVPNKTTAELRNIIAAFISHNTESLQIEFDKLEGPEKFRAIERLLPYVLPKAAPEEPFEQKALPAPTIILSRTDSSAEPRESLHITRTIIDRTTPTN